MKINYIKFGSGKKNMLILPGLAIKPICAAPQPVIDAFQMFADDFTVYLFDQRVDMPEDYGFEQMCEDVYDKICELDLKDIYLYGVSMGGVMAMMLTEKYPQLVKKLALCSTAHKGNPLFAEWHKHAQNKDSYKLVDSFMENVYSEEFNEKFKEAAMVAYKDISDDEFRRLAILTKDLLESDISDILPALKDKDVLLLGSKTDKIFPYEVMKQLAELIECESFFYEGYGHAVYDEEADVKERIKEFFLR